MRYYIVPAVDGVLDVDYRDMYEGHHLVSSGVCYVRVAEAVEKRASWAEVTEADFNQAKTSTEAR